MTVNPLALPVKIEKAMPFKSDNIERSSKGSPQGARKTVMKDTRSQAHVKWECKYHVVILPKYRKKVMCGKIRRRIGEILRDLSRQKGITMEEGNAVSDHVHMLLSVPPKYSIAMVIGLSLIHI